MSRDTIVALATPPGRGGVGIIRLSGPKSLDIASRINGSTPLKPRIAKFCSFYNTNQEVLDQGIMLYFKAPHSFTGEDVVEIQGHGSPVVLDLLIKECIVLGAGMANPGEFSERAFLNDKMDLTQAEAIADLIQASSETAARMAFKTLQGEFSNKINAINKQLIYLRMYVEAAIDFPEEEIDFLNDGKVGNLLSEIRQALDLLYRQANQGVLLQEGLNIVIAGKPNAGKSTLINYLSGRQVAIVTDIAGTTRDVMRERILLDDIPLHLIDTAGLRESDCIIEQEGIRRAFDELKKADCVLLLSDVNDTNPQLSAELEALIDKKIPLIKVFNKIDTQAMPPKVEDDAVYVSIKHELGMDALKDRIKKTIGYQPLEGQFLARRRHLQAIEKAQGILETGYRQLTEHKALELLAEDLAQAHQSLCEITGEFTSDDLLGAIFSSFCIGK